jgi:predicted ATPase
MRTLHKLQIKGFKSIASAEIELRDLNVVIGANGSGKSNLIGVFRLLERVLTGNLRRYVADEPDRLLHHGRKVTPQLSLTLTLEHWTYRLELVAAQSSLHFEFERIESPAGPHSIDGSEFRGQGESQFDTLASDFRKSVPKAAFAPIRNVSVHHFHDTSESSAMKGGANLDDNRFLRPDAANLAAYLYLLQEKHADAFRQIEEHVRLVAPFFDRFVLAPSRLNEQKIKLEWRQKGSDAYFDAYSLSDGTLRFICLATLLLQPSPPGLILLDEPELGLHPYAIRILAEMLEAASRRSQVLLATQSVTLLNQFAPADLLVAENEAGATMFKRLDEVALQGWLADFSLGDLWEKNVLGGRP